jgi:hypothetical protein
LIELNRWLSNYFLVSAVCHHGEAEITAIGLRAGKPTIVIPYFGDQFFWGSVIEKCGVGPKPLSTKTMTIDQLVDAFHFVHKSTTRSAAEQIQHAILNDNGCITAVHTFLANLPLNRMYSDLEPTFAACFRLKKCNLQISRPVAQVLVGAGVLDASELCSHITRQWQFVNNNRIHLSALGIIVHCQKAFSIISRDTTTDLQQTSSQRNSTMQSIEHTDIMVNDNHQDIGHLSASFQ